MSHDSIEEEGNVPPPDQQPVVSEWKPPQAEEPVGVQSEHAQPQVPWGWGSVGAVLLLVIGGIFVLRPVLQTLIQVTGISVGDNISSPVLYAMIAMIYLLGLAGVYFFAARKQGGWDALGLRFPRWWYLALAPLLFVVEIIGIVVINTTIALIQGTPFENPQAEMMTGGEPLSTPMLLLLLLLVAVLAPVVEELFFRGMIYPLLRQGGARIAIKGGAAMRIQLSTVAPVVFGVLFAIVGSAALFSFVHLIPLLFPSLFFVGLILGTLREVSGSLLPGILLHIIQNWVAVIVIDIAMSTPPEQLSLGLF
jgi:hypothetical protein